MNISSKSSQMSLVLVANFCVLMSRSGFAFSDTVWLKNGDRLSGTVKLLDTNKLLLETDYGGSVSIDWDKVATLQTDRKMLVEKKAYGADLEVDRIRPAEKGKVGIETEADGFQIVNLKSVNRIVSPRPFLRDFSWKGNIDAALDYKSSESNTADYNVDLKMQARHDLWRHNVQGSYNKEKTEDTVATDNWSIQYAADRFFNEKFFWQGRLAYTDDNIQDISRQRTLGTGPGFQFWDNELGAFSLAALLNRADYEFRGGNETNFYSASFKWDYSRYFYGQTVQIFTAGEFARPLDNTAVFGLDAEAGLRYKVTNWASVNVKASKQLISGAEGDFDETKYTFGFGVSW